MGGQRAMVQGVDLIVEQSAEAVSGRVAELMADTMAARPAAQIVLATGNSPIPAYRRLARMVQERGLDLRRITLVQLDEYAGIADDDPRSLYRWMQTEAIAPLGISEDRVIRFDPLSADPGADCRRLDAAVRAGGGLDLAVLGLGPNGHLGFNEPPCAADAPTRPIVLTPQSVASNAVYWGGPDKVPRRAVTMGLDLILAARRIVLVVTGAHKRQILRQVVVGPVSPKVPASYLQNAPETIIVADRAAWPESGPDTGPESGPDTGPASG